MIDTPATTVHVAIVGGGVAGLVGEPDLSRKGARECGRRAAMQLLDELEEVHS